MEDLRNKLKRVSSRYMLVKNSMCLRALDKLGIKYKEDYFQGSSGISFDSHDATSTSKILVDFAKENEKFRLKGACIEGELYSADIIKDLASIPPRDVLIAQLLSCFNAPVSGMVGAMSGIIRKFLYAINAIKDKKEKEGGK